jgi:hypothetical protein
MFFASGQDGEKSGPLAINQGPYSLKRSLLPFPSLRAWTEGTDE